MLAVVIEGFGPPSVLQAREVPRPAGADVIDVVYANVTFVETQVRAGRPPHPSMLPTLPAVLGNGVGGTLDGAPVVASLGGRGGYAQAAAAPAPIAVPDGVGLRDAVALLADGRTALSVVQTADVTAGEEVLVLAAAGGVGTLLVQLCAAAGARVIGLASSPEKRDLARELGAAATGGYATWPEQVDVVLDGVGGQAGAAALAALRPGGRFVPFGMASGGFTDVSARDDVTVAHGGPPTPEQLRALSQRALDLAAEGVWRPVVGQEHALADAATAHAAIEARATVGKTLLRAT